MKRYYFSFLIAIVLVSSIEGQPALTEIPRTLDNHGTLAAVLDSCPDPKLLPVFHQPKKSVKKAFLLSLLVPGTGERYIGHKHQARGFYSAEGLIWGLALFSKIQGEIWKKDYIAYASQEAGSNPDRLDDNYYQNIYEWPNSMWYNEDQWRQAREIYSDDPAAQEAYVAGKLYGEIDAWEWENYDDWYRFRSLRVKSRNALHRISYSLGAAFLNRLLSSVNAARLAKRYNKSQRKTTSNWDWHLECTAPSKSELALTFRATF